MSEAITQKTSLNEAVSSGELVKDLDLRKEDIEKLHSMFRSYVEETRAQLLDEHSITRTIRHFLHERKKDTRAAFSNSVLGQSGCFAFSVKSYLLAGALGIQTGLARSTGTRALHVMLVDVSGNPYDIREFEKGGIKPMTAQQVRAYGQYLQPFVGAGNTIRDRLAKIPKPTVNALPIIPCEEEVEA